MEEENNEKEKKQKEEYKKQRNRTRYVEQMIGESKVLIELPNWVIDEVDQILYLLLFQIKEIPEEPPSYTPKQIQVIVNNILLKKFESVKKVEQKLNLWITKGRLKKFKDDLIINLIAQNK